MSIQSLMGLQMQAAMQTKNTEGRCSHVSLDCPVVRSKVVERGVQLLHERNEQHSVSHSQLALGYTLHNFMAYILVSHRHIDAPGHVLQGLHVCRWLSRTSATPACASCLVLTTGWEILHKLLAPPSEAMSMRICAVLLTVMVQLRGHSAKKSCLIRICSAEQDCLWTLTKAVKRCNPS